MLIRIDGNEPKERDVDELAEILDLYDAGASKADTLARLRAVGFRPVTDSEREACLERRARRQRDEARSIWGSITNPAWWFGDPRGSRA